MLDVEEIVQLQSSKWGVCILIVAKSRAIVSCDLSIRSVSTHVRHYTFVWKWFYSILIAYRRDCKVTESWIWLMANLFLGLFPTHDKPIIFSSTINLTDYYWIDIIKNWQIIECKVYNNYRQVKLIAISYTNAQPIPIVS